MGRRAQNLSRIFTAWGIRFRIGAGGASIRLRAGRIIAAGAGAAFCGGDKMGDINETYTGMVMDWLREMAHNNYNDNRQITFLDAILDIRDRAGTGLSNYFRDKQGNTADAVQVRCMDCKHYYKGHCQCDDTIYWCREPDWFCADGKRRKDDA